MADGKHPAPHDALFKVAFSDIDNGAALLRAVVSEELRDRVDWSTLQLRPGSFRDRDLKGSENDLLFSAMAGSTEVFFYFLVEHQSSVDAVMAWRLWRYVTRVWDRYATKVDGKTRLPFVLPVVVYHGERPWTAPCSIAELIEVEPSLRGVLGPYMPNLRYIVDDLTALDAQGLRARGLPACLRDRRVVGAPDRV